MDKVKLRSLFDELLHVEHIIENGKYVVSNDSWRQFLPEIIDQTILPTQFNVEGENGSLVLEVADRRLIRVGVGTREIDPKSLITLRNLRNTFHDFFERPETGFLVHEMPAEIQKVDTAIGLSKKSLSDLISTDVKRAGALLLLGARTYFSERVAAAILIHNGGIVTDYGKQELLAELQELLTVCVAFSSLEPSITLFGSLDDSGKIHCSIMTNECGLVFSTIGVSYKDIMDFFHKEAKLIEYQ